MSEDAHESGPIQNLRDLAATGYHFCRGLPRSPEVHV